MRHTDKLAIELRGSVYELLGPVMSNPQVAPSVAPEFELRIASLSELVALARSNVERDRYTREVVGTPVTEGNTRLPQQLAQLARGSALLDGHEAVNEEDFRLLRRAAFDSLPVGRRLVLEALVDGRSPYAAGLAKPVAQRALEDLQLIGVATESHLSFLAHQLLRQAQVIEK